MRNRVICLIAFLFTFNPEVFAQQNSETEKTKWFEPKGISAEYAGGFGMVSVGGWFEPFRKTEFAFTAGYTPAPYGDIWSTNLLVQYKTIQKKLNENFVLYPLNTGIFINVNYGDNIYVFWPDYYPQWYYEWNSAIRVGLFIEAELKYTSLNPRKNAGVFFQILSNDLYLGSYFANMKAVSVVDILFFGAGVRYYFNAKATAPGKD